MRAIALKHKYLKLDQRKIDFAKRYFGAKSEQVETWAAAGLDGHIFPNSIVLPTFDGALWYRMRPHADDRDRCIVDIWALGRFAPGREPAVEQHIFDGFEAFRGQCEFLEDDFSNIEAVNRGVKSRGFLGVALNPVQEGGGGHFHDLLTRDLRGEVPAMRPIGFTIAP